MNNSKNIDNIFAKEPPITGGTFYASKHNIKAKEQIINSNVFVKQVDETVRKYLNSENFTYNLYWLLHQQADYFTSIVQFRYTDKTLTENIYKVIRCAAIYGRAAIWFTSSGIIPYYINKVEYSPMTGKPIYMEVQLIDNVFSQKEISPTFDNWLTFDINSNPNAFDNIYIMNSSSCGFGGLIRWLPFLKQLDNLLKMVYVHSYTHLKYIIYDVKEPAFIDKEIELFFNNQLPFLINIGDDTLIKNKFKEFNFTNSQKDEIFNYLEKFLNTYYSLIGRRYNVDYKRERNITSEVEASQDNFDILQNEFKQYILLMLEWISNKTGLSYVI